MIILSLILLSLITAILVSDYRRWQSFTDRVDAIDAKLEQAQTANRNAEYYNKQAEQTRAITLGLINALSEMTRTFKAMADKYETRRQPVSYAQPKPKNDSRETNYFAVLCTSAKVRTQTIGDYKVTYRDVIPLQNCAR